MKKTKLSQLLPALSILALCSLFMLVSACDGSTAPKTGTLTGRVVLVNDTGNPELDPVDFSGVVVALYELAELDTTIVRINQEYPHVGVHISQVTEFDHRTQQFVMVASTDATGYFFLPMIPTGLYNLVLVKENWGIRYIHDLLIEEGNNNLSYVAENTVMHPETIVPSVVTTPMTFMRDHVYRFPHDTIIVSDIFVQSPCLLIVDPTKKIEISGNLNCEESSKLWHITSSDRMQSIEYDSEILEFEKVVFNQQDNLIIPNLIYENSIDGLVIDNINTEIRNSIFRKNSDTALVANSGIQNLHNINIVENYAKGVQGYSGISIENSIFAHNIDACQLIETNSEIKNCYFINNRLACRPFYGDLILEYNCFDANWVGVALCASDPLIQRNNFYSNSKDVELNMYYSQSVDYCNPSLMYNNFMGSSLYISLWGENSFYGTIMGWGANQDQHYPHNYFCISDLTYHIYDAGHPETQDYPAGHYVDVTPRLSSRVIQAGIQ